MKKAIAILSVLLILSPAPVRANACNSNLPCEVGRDTSGMSKGQYAAIAAMSAFLFAVIVYRITHRNRKVREARS